MSESGTTSNSETVTNMFGRARTMLVTPELAALWTSPGVMPMNRPARAVDRFVRLMRSNQFMFTGEPIQFTGYLDNGTARLVNGQNRLKAIEVTGMPQIMLVVEGVDPDAMLHLDTGARRSFADNLRINGLATKNVAHLASAVRLHWQITLEPERVATAGGGSEISYAQLMQWAEKNHDLLMQSISIGRQLRKVFSTPDSAGSVAWMVLSESTSHDVAEVDEFFNGLIEEGQTGIVKRQRGEERLDLPRNALRRYLTNSVAKAPQRRRPRSPIQVAVMIKGWNAHVRGNSVGALSWRPGAGEEFPTVL